MAIALNKGNILPACVKAATNASGGFTLLELLVALAIAALLLTGVYRVVDGTAKGQRILEQRQEQLHLWIYLRRILQRDLDKRHVVSGDTIVLGSEAGFGGSQTGLMLHCSGGVVPGHLLGPLVDVSYTWEENPEGEGVTWVREVRSSPGGHMEPGLNMRITTELASVSFSVLDKDGWKGLDAELERPLRAIRWQFHWSLIGPWTLVRRLAF